LAREWVSQVRTFTPNFTAIALKMWAYSLIAKIGIFGTNLPPPQAILHNLARAR